MTTLDERKQRVTIDSQKTRSTSHDEADPLIPRKLQPKRRGQFDAAVEVPFGVKQRHYLR